MVLCRPAISSLSLGRAAVHDLPSKLLEAEIHGIEGIELFQEDLEYLAKATSGGLQPENEIQAARVLRQLCKEFSITIICLQPFWYDEGILDRKEHLCRLSQLKHRMRLAKILHTDIILIPSTFLSAKLLSPDFEAIVADLREAADLGAQQNPPIRFAYEGLCWGTHVNTWDACWDVVRAVDRPNFGICLDTFNIAGRVYADPAEPSGRTPNAEADISTSLERFVRTVEVEKVFLVQVADAERLSSPLVKGHEYYSAEQPSRMSWSRNCRLFYGEEDRGAYLPIKAVTQAIFYGLGYRGWVINELFSRSVWNPDPATPAEHARRSAEAWNKLVKDCNLEVAKKAPVKHLVIPAESWGKLVTDCKIEAGISEVVRG